MPCLSIAIRSIAHAEGEARQALGVVADVAHVPKTFGSTMPAPRISSQPVALAHRAARAVAGHRAVA